MKPLRLSSLSRWAMALMACCFSAASAQSADDCTTVARKDHLSCWSECPSGSSRTARNCIEQCDSDYEAAKSACRGSDGAKARLHGSYRGGEDGCYLGECPPDLNKKIDSRRKPRKTQPVEDDIEDPADPPVTTTAHSPNPPTTSICQTPQLWCRMWQRGFVGMSCFCTTPMGTAYGITIPER